MPTRFTSAAIEIFRQMQATSDDDTKWWKLHSQLHDELRKTHHDLLRPWTFPIVPDQDEIKDGPDLDTKDPDMRERAWVLYQLLEEASEA